MPFLSTNASILAIGRRMQHTVSKFLDYASLCACLYHLSHQACCCSILPGNGSSPVQRAILGHVATTAAAAGFAVPQHQLPAELRRLTARLGRVSDLLREADAAMIKWTLLAKVAMEGDELALTFLSCEAGVKLAVRAPLEALLGGQVALGELCRVEVLLQRSACQWDQSALVAALGTNAQYGRLHAMCRAVTQVLRAAAAAEAPAADGAAVQQQQPQCMLAH